MTEAPDRNGVVELLDRSHAAFAAGDADTFAGCFADDAQLLLLHREAVFGRDAIRDLWRDFYSRFDTSAWEPHSEIVDVHDGRAYALSTYTEVLLKREDGSRTLVRGRLVHFLHRGAGDRWEITMIMNSHSHPMEPIE